MDKDGKLLLLEFEEKLKVWSELEFIDEFLEDFDLFKYKEKLFKLIEKIEEFKVVVLVFMVEVVFWIFMCSIQLVLFELVILKGMVLDDVVEVLVDSLGKKEVDLEDGKFVMDKVKEKVKEEDCEKFGEKEEIIFFDYRLEEVKDKDGKLFLLKEFKEQFLFVSEDFFLDVLFEDFFGL